LITNVKEFRVKKSLIFAFACVAASGTASAQNMPVSTFLAKADALKAKGPFALLSSDVGALKTEVQAAALAYRTERKAREAAGGKPEVCPPAKGLGIDSDEMTASFRTIPPAQRATTTVKQAWIGFIKRKYPCPR
jgi:hypothetical protein